MQRLDAAAAQKRQEEIEEEEERRRRAAQPLLKETAFDRRKVRMGNGCPGGGLAKVLPALARGGVGSSSGHMLRGHLKAAALSGRDGVQKDTAAVSSAGGMLLCCSAALLLLHRCRSCLPGSFLACPAVQSDNSGSCHEAHGTWRAAVSWAARA